MIATYPQIKTISILGCGWYGLPLATSLLQRGYRVKGSTTRPEKLDSLTAAGIEPYVIDFGAELPANIGDFFATDLLIITVPPGKASNAGASYTDFVSQVANLGVQYKATNLLLISSSSVYGEPNRSVNESTTPEPASASATQILQAENLLLANTKFQTTILRFGGLVGPGRHPSRFFSGKTNIANGRAPVNMIHLNDCIGVTESILAQKVFGHIFNACSPNHPSRQDFYTTAAEAMQLPAPQFVDEMNDWKIVESIQVTPLLNYEYQINNWNHWLRQSANNL